MGERVNRSRWEDGSPRRPGALCPSIHPSVRRPAEPREEPALEGQGRGDPRLQKGRDAPSEEAAAYLPSSTGKPRRAAAGRGQTSSAVAREPVSPPRLRRARSGAVGAEPGEGGCALQGHALLLYSPHRRTHSSTIDFRWVAVDGDTSGNHSWAQRRSFLTNFLLPVCPPVDGN